MNFNHNSLKLFRTLNTIITRNISQHEHRISRNSELAAEAFGRLCNKGTTKYYKIINVTSLARHKYWRANMMGMMDVRENVKILDAAGGQGAMTFMYLDLLKQKGFKETSCRATVCDICTPMMDLGKQKAESLGYGTDKIDWVFGDSQNLPFENDSFDIYIHAFGFKHIDIEKITKEAYRVLKPDGQAYIIDLAKAPNKLVRWMYYQYLKNVVPLITQLIWNEKIALKYIADAYWDMPENTEIVASLKKNGFRNVSCKGMSLGISAVYKGDKKL